MSKRVGRGSVKPVAASSESVAIDVHWTRVKDHKLIQWGIAYLGAALALAHGQELLGHAFHWPDVMALVLMIALTAGFPIALTLAWYHGQRGLQKFGAGELTIISLLILIAALFFTSALRVPTEHAEQEQRESGVDSGISSSRSPEGDSTASTPAPGAALTGSAVKPRIAILPFENLSPDPNNSFFTDGLHEEILSTLANRTRALSVISRTTMMQYRAASKPMAEIARELQADYVLEGSVRRDGENVRLALQLIDPVTDVHLWSRNYDRQLGSAMALQSEVAAAVAGQLSIELSGEIEVTAPTTDPEAYDLYLKARLARQALTGAVAEDRWRDVETLFGQALERDPKFALASAERAMVRLFMFYTNYDTTSANLDRARRDLDRAQSLAFSHPVVLAAASVAALVDQDYGRALELFETAERAGLSDPNMLVWKSNILTLHDHSFVRALQVFEEAATLDPANSYVFGVWVGTLLQAQQPNEALRVIERARLRQPENVLWGQSGLSVGVRGSFAGVWPVAAQVTLPTEAQATTLFNNLDLGVLVTQGIEAQRQGSSNRQSRSEVLRMFGASLSDSVRATQIANFFPFAVGSFPTAELYGWDNMIAGDRAAAAQNGRSMVDFVAAQEANKWNRWFLALLGAEARLFQGDSEAAVAAVHEALTYVSADAHYTNWHFARYKAAQTLAWAGQEAEAMDILESLTAPGGLTPTQIARDTIFTIPLANNVRFESLVARLEAQMAATTLH